MFFLNLRNKFYFKHVLHKNKKYARRHLRVCRNGGNLRSISVASLCGVKNFPPYF